MTDYSSEREWIMHLLNHNAIIRRVDGRHGDSFVDTTALESLITDGLAEVYINAGMDFVRLPQK